MLKPSSESNERFQSVEKAKTLVSFLIRNLDNPYFVCKGVPELINATEKNWILGKASITLGRSGKFLQFFIVKLAPYSCI